MRNIYNLASPPRNVPLLIRTNVLFGGTLNQLGWFFFGFGLIFVWVFALNADVLSWYYFLSDTERVSGTVSYSRRTGFSEGGGKHSDGTPVWANHYSFIARDGKKYESVSYALGRELKTNDSVNVEYVKGKPAVSRIRGMRREPMGPFVLFVLIFPLIGFIFVFFGIKSGFKSIRLLRYGKVGRAKLKSKTATSTKINNQVVYKLTFEFTAEDGAKYDAVAKSHKPELLEDEAEEQLLYDETNPEYAVLLDALPGAPDIDAQGRIQARGYFAGLPVLIIPLITVIGHGIYMCLRFIS
ncbi:MAG: hypothetical protein AB1599_09035 [Planctomycetota bacterium]